MRHTPIGFAIALVIAPGLAVTGGCGGSLLDSLAASGEATPVQVLNQLTAGDLAEAFANFRNAPSDTGELSQAAGITDEQRTAIEVLQRQVDAGAITDDAFIAEVATILGDSTPGSPFAGFSFLGSPFEVEGSNDFADLLGMTQEQQQQALLIYRLLHADIADIRAVAQDEIRALLNAQQRALIDQLATELFEQFGVPDEQRAGAQLVIDLLVNRLGLTFGQQSQIETVREDMGGAVQQLHALGQQDFLALLSQEQLAMLE